MHDYDPTSLSDALSEWAACDDVSRSCVAMSLASALLDDDSGSVVDRDRLDRGGEVAIIALAKVLIALANPYMDGPSGDGDRVCADFRVDEVFS